MCLTTRDATRLVAEEDIKVYKHLSLNYIPNENRTFWQRLFGKNKYIIQARASISDFTYEIDKVCPNEELKPFTTYGGLYEVERGYHSYPEMRPECNAVFIIPKGTGYIKGYYNDARHIVNLVSETIILKEIIKEND